MPVHGTCVALRGQGVLLTGKSGSGKSDLALRLIDRGFVLVADDQTILAPEGNRLMATPPPALAGKIEIRGIGIAEKDYLGAVPLCLAVELTDRAEVERLPGLLSFFQDGIDVPMIRLHAFDLSAPLKIEVALAGIGLKNRPEQDGK